MLVVRFTGALPREGQTAESCEDRFAVRWLPDGGLRVAVADGASSTLFSGLWAELLTDAFVSAESGDAILPEIPFLRQQWFERVTQTPLPWHQQTQLSLGAAAAFIGVVIMPSGLWKAVAVGDCALFQVREETCIEAFPAESAQDIAQLPALLRTHGGLHYTGEEAGRHVREGTLRANDRLFLVTDALAGWFLEEMERKREPWNWLDDIRDLRNFQRRVTQLHGLNRLKDDDKTLIQIGRTEKE